MEGKGQTNPSTLNHSTDFGKKGEKNQRINDARRGFRGIGAQIKRRGTYNRSGPGHPRVGHELAHDISSYFGRVTHLRCGDEETNKSNQNIHTISMLCPS